MSLIKKVSVACAGACVITIIGLILLRQKLPPVVPLLYGLPVSKNQLVPSLALAIPSLVAIFFTFTNLVIASITKDKFLEKTLSGLSITITLLAIITTLNIFNLIGS